MRRQSSVIGGVSLVGALMADRLFKFIVRSRLAKFESDGVTGPLRFGYYPNTGIGLGIQFPVWLIIGLVGLIVIVLLIWLAVNYRRLTPIVRWAMGLVLIGAISNLFDRMRYGHVIDVFNFYDWSIFNLADGWIIIGVFIIIVELVVGRKKIVESG
jgi:signal peptidase II